MANGKKVPSSVRRQMLVKASIEIARKEGARAVTLARAADACGVSKPIAYRIFQDLPDLLVHMQREVLAGYEATIAAQLEDAATHGASRERLLGVLARAYVEHSLGPGAVYDTVTAALAAMTSAEEPSSVLPERYVEIAATFFALPQNHAAVGVAMFLGAADNLVAAVQAGWLESEDAVISLVDLFLPMFERGEST